MKMKMVIKLALLVACLSGSPLALSKEIDLYEQPQANTKIIGKIDSSLGMIPIFTPKTGEWIKVADPRNGNVGWVKSTELNNNTTMNVITQRFMQDGKGGQQSYQIIEYGPPQQINQQQAENMMQKMQQQHQAMHKAAQDMMKEMNALFQSHWSLFNAPFPMIMPIVIMPGEKAEKANKPQTPTLQPTTHTLTNASKEATKLANDKKSVVSNKVPAL